MIKFIKEELYNQIGAMAEEFANKFLDAYQCMDWGITPKEFAKRLLEQTQETLFDYVEDMENG